MLKGCFNINFVSATLRSLLEGHINDGNPGYNIGSLPGYRYTKFFLV